MSQHTTKIYNAGQQTDSRSFPTYREAARWAAEQERAGRGVSQISSESFSGPVDNRR